MDLDVHTYKEFNATLYYTYLGNCRYAGILFRRTSIYTYY